MLTSDIFKQQIPKKFVRLKLDNPRDKSKQTSEEIAQYKKLSKEYTVRGVTTIIVADAKGKEQHRQVGYSSRQTAQQWVTKLMAAVKAGGPRLLTLGGQANRQRQRRKKLPGKPP